MKCDNCKVNEATSTHKASLCSDCERLYEHWKYLKDVLEVAIVNEQAARIKIKSIIKKL